LDVFQRSQVFANAAAMAYITNVTAKIIGMFSDILPIPMHRSGHRLGKPAKDPQQAGFATAIRALEMYDFGGARTKIESSEDRLLAPRTREFGNL
jgi:hypothetical protein